MTLDEALQLVDGKYAVNDAGKSPPNTVPPGAIGSAGFVPGIPRLSIPDLQESDAGIGVADPIDGTTGQPVRGSAGYSTALPSGLSTAATWNPSLAYRAGQMIGTEARREGFNVLLAGGVNLARDPRNGRNFEYAGEDPLLAGTIVGWLVRGIQDRHVISTVKHFALNDQETGRMTLSSNIDWAAARESDLLAFELAIDIGQPGSVMCAYNRVNSVYACSNAELLNKTLKEDWQFRGWVMSDWGAVHATADALAGLDQESGDYFDAAPYFGAELKRAVQTGRVPARRLLDMVHRILRSMFAVGLVDHPPVIMPIDSDEDAAMAQAAAEQGMVLLKNDSDQLPLARHLKSIAVIGSHADVGVLEGGGSSEVWPVGGPAWELGGIGFPYPILYLPSSPLQAISARAGAAANVQYDDGSDPDRSARLAQASDVAIVFASQWLAESFDAPDLSLPDMQDTLIERVAAVNPHTIVVLETGNPVSMPWLSSVSAVLEAWYPGARGGEAIARLLYGEVNPSGRLPITFPESEAQLPRPTIPGIDTPQAMFDVNYTEGSAVGYKWYDMRNFTPMFPFGFGLSYTTFSYAGLHVASDATMISFDVTNTGARAGMDTPQVYLGFPPGSGQAPKRLIGFRKVHLAPGQTGHVDITVDPRLLAVFDRDAGGWRILRGTYAVYVGASSREMRLSASVTLAGRQLKR